jgi:hypothetical protein
LLIQVNQADTHTHQNHHHHHHQHRYQFQFMFAINFNNKPPNSLQMNVFTRFAKCNRNAATTIDERGYASYSSSFPEQNPVKIENANPEFYWEKQYKCNCRNQLAKWIFHS